MDKDRILGWRLLTQVFGCISVEYNEEELRQELHMKTLKGQKKEIASLIEESHGPIEPKAVYAYLEVVKILGDGVCLESGDELKGLILSDMLKRGQKVAPYVVTIGPQASDRVSKLARDNVFLAFVLDKIGKYALRIAEENVKLLVEKALGDKVSDFGPREGTGESSD